MLKLIMPYRGCLIATSVAAAWLCAATIASADPLKILFIGNSYTQQVVGSPSTRNHDIYGGEANQIIGDQYFQNDTYTSAFEGFVGASSFAQLDTSGALSGGTHGSQTIAYGGIGLWGHISDYYNWDGNQITNGDPLLYQSITAGAASNLLGESYDWDVIVLQEYSSVPAFAAKNGSTSSSYRNMWQGVWGTDDDSWGVSTGIGEYLAMYQSDARVVLYNPWARRSDNGIYDATPTESEFTNQAEMQGFLNDGYDILKQWIVDAGLSSSLIDIARIGDAFAAAYNDPLFTEFDLLGGDDPSHPTRLGEYLAGAVLFETIFGQSSVGLNFNYYDIRSDQQLALQRIATSITGVPEPTTFVLLAGGAGVFAVRRRRRLA